MKLEPREALGILRRHVPEMHATAERHMFLTAALDAMEAAMHHAERLALMEETMGRRVKTLTDERDNLARKVAALEGLLEAYKTMPVEKLHPKEVNQDAAIRSN